MSNWKKEASKYLNHSRNFSSYDGLAIRDGFIGQTRNANFIGESSRADGGATPSGMGGDMFSTLNDGNKLYTVVVTNTNSTGSPAITAIVFGANKYGTGEFQPNAGVTVNVLESSHAQVRAESQNSPLWINGLRYFTTTVAQMQGQTLTIYKQTAAGEVNSQIFRPLSFKTAYQQQTTQIDAPGYKFLVDGSTEVQVPVIGGETVTMVLQIGGRFDSSNIVNGQSSLAVANQRELATGLVQVIK